ncbi:hypothetical protein Tco_0777119 [Tanacetum coccineum]
MVTPESQRVNRYIRGLAPEIKPHVTSSEPATIQGAVSMANRLTTDGIKDGLFKKKENARNKRRNNISMLVNIRSVQNAVSTILVTALCVVDVTMWVTLPDTAWVELLMKDQGQLVLSVEILTTLGGTAQGLIEPLPWEEIAQTLFDVVIGMDWLSKLRAKIVCYEKIVHIPLSNRDILEVHGERPKGNLKQLKTMKVNEPKLEDIPVICEFPGVFPEDLTGLPLSREVEFCIDLIPGAMPVVKSPYRLAPTEMQELSNQLKELQE